MTTQERARRNRAIDLLEWERAFGMGPVSLARWREVRWPDMSPKAAGRFWLRMREYWRRDGVPHKVEKDPDPLCHRNLVSITPAALEWARTVLDGEPSMECLTEPKQLDPPGDRWGPHARDVHVLAIRYLEAIERVKEDPCDVAPVLVQELLSLASWYHDLGAPLHMLARDFWGATDNPSLLVPIARAAGLKVYKVRAERWVRRDEATKLLEDLLSLEGN